MMFRLRPKRVAQFSPFRGAQTVECETKGDSNQPAAEAVAVAQTIELAIGAQQRFLRDIFRIGGVAQNAARPAIREGATLSQALPALAPRATHGRRWRP